MICPDLLLLLPQHIEQAIKAFCHDIAVKVKRVALDERDGLRVPHHLLVLPVHTYLTHRLGHHRLERSSQLSAVFPLKYSVAAVGLPVKIFRASSKLIAVIASRKIGL